MRSILREDLHLEPVDVPMDAEALRAHPHAAPFDWSLEGRSNVVATWGPGEPDEVLGTFADPQRAHRRGQPRAVGPVGRARPLRRRSGRGVDDRQGRGRHEVRSGRHRGRRAGSPVPGTRPSGAGHDRVGAGGRVQRQRDAADPARRLHGRGRRHRRAVRRRDHHVTGGGALVQRADHGRAGTCRRGPQRHERDREEPRGDRCAPRSRVRSERRPSARPTTCSPIRSISTSARSAAATGPRPCRASASPATASRCIRT